MSRRRFASPDEGTYRAITMDPTVGEWLMPSTAKGCRYSAGSVRHIGRWAHLRNGCRPARVRSGRSRCPATALPPGSVGCCADAPLTALRVVARAAMCRRGLQCVGGATAAGNPPSSRPSPSPTGLYPEGGSTGADHRSPIGIEPAFRSSGRLDMSRSSGLVAVGTSHLEGLCARSSVANRRPFGCRWNIVGSAGF